MKVLSLLFIALLYPIQTIATPILVAPPPPISAHAYLLIDFHSGKVLMEKNADERVDPASLTKLMTAYLVFQKISRDKIKLTDTVIISEKAWRMTGSRMYLEIDSRVSVELLLKGMIIQSGNDASLALAEFVGGTEAAFATLMNEQAQRLGLTNTHYTNSTGLPDEQHYSSARDTARLAQALIQDFPEYYRWYSEREFTYNSITQYNRNRLLRQTPSVAGMEVDGMKTGYTEAAGYCLVASARLGEMRLISVVMGTKSESARTRMSEKMLDYGFRFFETYRLYKALDPIDTERVWQGHISQLQLGLSEPLYVTVPNGEYDPLKAILRIDKYIMAPVKAFEPQGTLEIRLLDGEVISSRPVVALSSVEKGPIWKRLIDSFLLLFY
jgi:D-alanyl-D-alanine carboxypeptidase (penicillin-binding protein 5/6)